MSRNNRLRVLCYDVSDDRRRRQIARILEDCASRVQFSVFETRMTARGLARVVTRLEPLLGKNDSLRVYTIGGAGERHCEVYGSGVHVEAEAAFWLL